MSPVLGSIIALSAVALLVAASIRSLVGNKKKKGSACTGSCACCSGCGCSCHSVTK